MDDKNFYPCTCDYQICRFCWHRIKTTGNGLCPACRRIYPENPANFEPLTPEELQKCKLQKKMKDLQKKQKIAENRKQLGNIRVIQKNLVFAVGLPLELSQDGEKKEKVIQMFRQFGLTQKETITDRTNYAGAQGPSACVYITYQKPEDAVKAVKLLTNTKMDGRTIKVSLGTTKYCSNFLKGVQCPKAECLYLHELADEEASFTKEDIHLGKHLDYEMKLLEQSSNSSSHNKFPLPSNETNHVNNSRNIDAGSDSSDDLHQNNFCDNSDVSELSPSSNQTLQNMRNIGPDVNNETENNHQNIHSGNPELRTNSDTSSKSIFRSEENIIINNSNFQDTMNPLYNNRIQKKETEPLQQPNFLNNQIFESASRGQSSSKESNFLRFISTAMFESGQKKEVVNMQHEEVNTGRTKREDDPDLEFDPCQESLNALQDLVISEAKERARIQYNAMNRSPLSNRSPTLSSVQSFDNFGHRNASFQPVKVRDPPPGFSNNCTQSIHYKPAYETAPSLLNKSQLPLHNQLGGVRTNYSLQRYPQPGVTVNNSFFPDYTSTLQAREVPEYISPVLQQHNQRLMNLSQIQYPIAEQRSSALWNNTSQSQWRPMENMFFNQSVTENRTANDFNMRMPIRSNDATIRQWQQFPTNVNNLSPFQDAGST